MQILELPGNLIICILLRKAPKIRHYFPWFGKKGTLPRGTAPFFNELTLVISSCHIFSISYAVCHG